MTSPGENGSGFVPLSTLMPGSEPAFLDQLHQRRAVLGVLADRLVVEDDAGDVVLHRLDRAEQKLAIIAPRIGRGFDADRIEALLDRARGFVGGEDALAGLHHGFGDLVQF